MIEILNFQCFKISFTAKMFYILNINNKPEGASDMECTHFICTHICTHTNKTQIINFSISSQFRLPNSSSTTAGQCIYDLFFRERKNGELNLPGLMSVFLFYLRIITKKFSLNLNWLLYILSILKTSLFIGFY